MSAPTWAVPLSFEGLDLNLTELDVMADLEPNWIGWAAETVVAAAADDAASTTEISR